MTIRTELVVALMARCRTEPGGEGAEWFEGWPGDTPPRERVWLSDMTGDVGFPLMMGLPTTVEDMATVTLSAVSSTGGQARTDAMTSCEGYLSTVLTVLAATPDLGGVVAHTIDITPSALRGPYSMPNTADLGGFMAIGELDLVFHTRPI